MGHLAWNLRIWISQEKQHVCAYIHEYVCVCQCVCQRRERQLLIEEPGWRIHRSSMYDSWNSSESLKLIQNKQQATLVYRETLGFTQLEEVAGSISTKAMTGNSGEWAEMESLIISWTENVTERSEESAYERNLSCKSAKENAYIPKSRRDTTNFLLGHRQKLRKLLKAQEDSSAQPAKRWPRDIPTPPPWAPAPQSSYQGWALGWGRCCQDSPRAGGRLGRRKSGPHAKPTES